MAGRNQQFYFHPPYLEKNGFCFPYSMKKCVLFQNKGGDSSVGSLAFVPLKRVILTHFGISPVTDVLKKKALLVLPLKCFSFPKQ